MKILVSIGCLLLGASIASAQTQPTPSVKPGEDAPTKAMDSATPEMKAPGGTEGEHPPAAAVDKAVPEMKSGDAAKKDPNAPPSTTPSK